MHVLNTPMGPWQALTRCAETGIVNRMPSENLASNHPTRQDLRDANKIFCVRRPATRQASSETELCLCSVHLDTYVRGTKLRIKGFLAYALGFGQRPN